MPIWQKQKSNIEPLLLGFVPQFSKSFLQELLGFVPQTPRHSTGGTLRSLLLGETPKPQLLSAREWLPNLLSKFSWTHHLRGLLIKSAQADLACIAEAVRCGESCPGGGFPAPWGLVNPKGGSPRCSTCRAISIANVFFLHASIDNVCVVC